MEERLKETKTKVNIRCKLLDRSENDSQRILTRSKYNEIGNYI